MLQNAYFLAKLGADTAENEQHFAEIFDPFFDVQSGICEMDGDCVTTSQTTAWARA